MPCQKIQIQKKYYWWVFKWIKRNLEMNFWNININMRKIRLKDGTRIWFDKGNFDDWCVFVKEKNEIKCYTDKDYFNVIKSLSKIYGVEMVYDDFKTIYFSVNKQFDINKMVTECESIAKHYAEKTLKWWIVLYMTMVAEENKKNKILGKRIKHLGIYNILFDKYEIDYVTSYMNGMKWYELNKLMNERGI